jgi:hypothetical protein
VKFKSDAQPTASLESILQLQRLPWYKPPYFICFVCQSRIKQLRLLTKSKLMEPTGGETFDSCVLQEPQLRVVQHRMPGSLCTPTILFAFSWTGFYWLRTQRQCSLSGYQLLKKKTQFHCCYEPKAPENRRSSFKSSSFNSQTHYGVRRDALTNPCSWFLYSYGLTYYDIKLLFTCC